MSEKPEENRHLRHSTHGLTAIKRATKELGNRGLRVIDKRTQIGKALLAWGAELVADLGGDGAISTQQRMLIDLALRTRLMLDSIDAWLVRQPSLVNKRQRSVYPVVLQRQQLANALAGYLGSLGLERRSKPVPDLHDFLRQKTAEKQESTA